MGRVDAFALPGLELFFPSDDHPPPHFHVLKPGAWEIKVVINWQKRQYDFKYTPVRPKHPGSARQRPTADEGRLIRDLTIEHRRALLREHRIKVRGRQP